MINFHKTQDQIESICIFLQKDFENVQMQSSNEKLSVFDHLTPVKLYFVELSNE